MKHWTWIVPVASSVLFVVAFAIGVSPAVAAICTLAMVGAVIAAVHHAEVVAHRVGEPYGATVASAPLRFKASATKPERFISSMKS